MKYEVVLGISPMYGCIRYYVHCDPNKGIHKLFVALDSRYKVTVTAFHYQQGTDRELSRTLGPHGLRGFMTVQMNTRVLFQYNDRFPDIKILITNIRCSQNFNIRWHLYIQMVTWRLLNKIPQTAFHYHSVLIMTECVEILSMEKEYKSTWQK